MERDRAEVTADIKRMSVKLVRAIGFDPIIERRLEATDWERESGLTTDEIYNLYRLLRLAEYRVNENKKVNP